jgi:tubulin alpha
VNETIAQLASSFLCSLDPKGTISLNVVGLCTNLVPYQRVHFIQPSFSPFVPAHSFGSFDFQTSQIVNDLFTCNGLLSVNPAHGKYMGCVPMFRGDIFLNDVHTSIQTARETKYFVDWLPTGIKPLVSGSSPPPLLGNRILRSGCMLANTTALAGHFSVVDFKFDMLYQKRAFVHWYVGRLE